MRSQLQDQVGSCVHPYQHHLIVSTAVLRSSEALSFFIPIVAHVSMSDQSSTSYVAASDVLDRQRHMRYFAHSLKSLPSAYAHLDTNRLTLVHFAVHSLDLLGALDDDNMLQKLNIDKADIVNWIYSLQILPSEGGGGSSSSTSSEHGGFKGGTFLGGQGAQYKAISADDGVESVAEGTKCYEYLPYQGFEYDHGHVAMTYTALCTLAALGDDLSRFDRMGAVTSLKQLQRGDGR